MHTHTSHLHKKPILTSTLAHPLPLPLPPVSKLKPAQKHTLTPTTQVITPDQKLIPTRTTPVISLLSKAYSNPYNSNYPSRSKTHFNPYNSGYHTELHSYHTCTSMQVIMLKNAIHYQYILYTLQHVTNFRKSYTPFHAPFTTL